MSRLLLSALERSRPRDPKNTALTQTATVGGGTIAHLQVPTVDLQYWDSGHPRGGAPLDLRAAARPYTLPHAARWTDGARNVTAENYGAAREPRLPAPHWGSRTRKETKSPELETQGDRDRQRRSGNPGKAGKKADIIIGGPIRFGDGRRVGGAGGGGSRTCARRCAVWYY